ncbi:ROK family transcriptional regulator [Caulobacter sp. CCH9-E1]|jgi:predicted NBD/HSP70 family sugar kinase|uniref:ROK family transcriptional regulator n=1 Tax=Caulobacter sp. CCH9-E1 TaxID=1768768 RepID=UPI00082F3AF6|nr:ROK family transcriptional regulator [Caulobacter sp. CCH9-E1]
MISSSRLTTGHRLVLDSILRHGPSSRAEIAARTQFTRPAITQMVQDLADMDLVVEHEARRGQRGQPARPVALNGAAGFAVGVNFSLTYLEIAVVDLAGVVVLTHQAPLADHAPEAIAAVVQQELGRLAPAQGLDFGKMVGMGVSLPSDFYPDGSLATHMAFPNLKGDHLERRFGGDIGVPIFLENDGRACAIGERMVGAGRSHETFMLVHLGHGIGGGLIIDGKPYRGAFGNAGILGQFYPYGEARPSGLDLLETLRAAGHAVADFDALDQLPAKARPVLDAWIQRAADQLTKVLFQVSRFFGPEAVILAGRLPPNITAALAERIDFERVRPPMDDLLNAPILASAQGSIAGAIGAACVPIFNLLLPVARRD